MGEKQYKDFSSYLRSVLENSMLTGVPQIASAAGAPKKLLRALIFVICLIGFIYQSAEFMDLYWKFETILDIRVENPKKAEMPSLTICTNNGLKSSKVCADPYLKMRCSPIPKTHDKMFCNCMPHFCVYGGIVNKTMMDDSVVSELSYSEYAKYQPYLMQFEDLIYHCTSNLKEAGVLDEDCNIVYYKNIRCQGNKPNVLNACYTIHTLIDRPDAKEEQVLTQASEVLYLDAGFYEYSYNVAEPEIRIAIHNSRNILNPHVYGHSLKNGQTNIIRLMKTVKHLLPSPYETKCKDYLTQWKNRGGRGPTTEKECIEECRRNSSLEILGCVYQMLQGPTNEKICRDEVHDSRVLLKSQDCVDENCMPACYEVTYEAVKDVEFHDVFGKCMGNFNPVTNVVIQLDGLQTTTYIYNPKYENVEIFSYVGGYVGMWLGISLIAVFDFLETLLVILRYLFRQLLQQRLRKQRVQQIQRNL